MGNQEQHGSRRHLAVALRHRELVQCLDDVELAIAQQRPLRLAYFVSRLKTCAGDFFAAEGAVLQGFSATVQHGPQARHAAFYADLRNLQQRALRQELSVESVQALRCLVPGCPGLTGQAVRSHCDH